ncbi:MAG: hypothetical protein CSA51_04300 [Gammaproteobacteria bacterium]|nr:MAG: hypothetical protein CSA51_04300 [Gammaproteobacteria bacterium]
MALIEKLFDGPIDIVGDVHGEINALTLLLQQLGYDATGHHPDGRRLVFLGDLVDRGPDSAGVVDKVMQLIASGRAQCILGNHELNIVLERPMHGNGWIIQPNDKDPTPAGISRLSTACGLTITPRLPLCITVIKRRTKTFYPHRKRPQQSPPSWLNTASN